MDSGIISNQKDEEVADFLINSGYDDLDVVPISCIQTGSRAYGLHSSKSDRDYLGLHIMDTWQCLEHPKFRDNLQVIRRSFDEDFNKVPPGPTAIMSLDSFELWKATELLLKGAFSIYELVYLPTIHHDTTSEHLISLFREGLTTKIGYAAIGNYKSNWLKKPEVRKKTIMTFYRLLQAIYFLRESEFQWNAQQLWDYLKGNIPAATATLKLYMQPDTRNIPLTEGEVFFVKKELEGLVRETENAIVASRLPDRIPSAVLDEILYVIKSTRGNLI